MKIDLSKLLKGLEALPHTPAPKPKKVSPYVLTHILEPLKTDDYQCTWNPRFKGVDDYLLDWTKRRTA